jgi:hypothetical protein
MFHTNVLEKIKAQILDLITFSENSVLYENVEKYGTAGQATGYNMVQPDRPQATTWYSQTGHRLQYGTAVQATGYNMVQPERPQATIWYSRKATG